MSDNHAIMEAANARGLTYNGVNVTVSGAACEFAALTVSDREHPLFGFRTEVAWPTVDRVTRGSGTFS